MTTRRSCEVLAYRLKPNPVCIISALKECITSKDLVTGSKVHTYAIQTGLHTNTFVANTLVDMYAKCGEMCLAQKTFDKMPHRTTVSWNSLIMGYARMGHPHQALHLFSQMNDEGFTADSRTFLAALKACSTIADKFKDKTASFNKGVDIHSFLQRNGGRYESDIYVASALVDMYAKCGKMSEARAVFDKVTHRNLVIWNTIIAGYAQDGNGKVALELFKDMQTQGFVPDARTFVAALTACSSLERALNTGRCIHSQILTTVHKSNNFVQNALVDMYTKHGSLAEAKQVFNEIKDKDVVSWTALITGYAQTGEFHTALRLFNKMEANDVKPDGPAITAAIKACAGLGDLESGRRIHQGYCGTKLLQEDEVLVSSLVDFYGKCGCMVEARQVFEVLSKPDLVTWNSLLAGYTRRGDVDKVFEVFEGMQQADGVTFLCLLNSCVHAGLVDKGKEYFHLMSSNKYRISPLLEHVNCLVDLLARANRIEEAMEVVKKMEMEADAPMWKTVLSACSKFKNIELAKVAFDNLVRLNGDDSAAYALMANTCSGTEAMEHTQR